MKNIIIRENGFSDEDLAVIQRCAKALMSIDDIACILSVDENSFRESIHDKSSLAYVAYHKGKLETKLKLREQEITLALSGSPQAVVLAQEWLADMNDNEIL